MSQPCPTAERLRHFLAGLDDGPAAHVEACPACQAALEVMTAQTAVGPFPPTPNFLRGLGPEPAAEAAAPEVPGFEVVGPLGAGGMGTVFLAVQTSLRRLVALKLLRPDANDDGRLRIEAEAAARLTSAGIVQVYERGEHGGRPWLALEYCPGGTLAKRLERSPLPAAAAAALVERLARAVQEAHDKGVLHRDLKPSNVLFQDAAPEMGRPKVADFGLAKLTDADSGLTAVGTCMGTPSYAAPEQIGMDAPVGPAADVYGLGAVLYECLSGRPPFRGATAYETMVQVKADDPVPPSRIAPGLPRDLETVCLKCLRKSPAERYGSAAELADDLGRFGRGEAIRARPEGAARRAGRWLRKRPAWLVGLLLASALGAGLIAWKADAARRRQEHEEATALRHEYYAAMTYRRGAPVGVGPVSAERADGMLSSFRFHSRGGRVERVDLLHRLLEPLQMELWTDLLEWYEPGGRPPHLVVTTFLFRYDDDGVVRHQDARDAADERRWAVTWLAGGEARLAVAGGGALPFRVTWSPDGFAERLHRDGGDVALGNDAAGLPTLWTKLDAAGLPRPTGWASEHYEYDELGRMRRRYNRDAAGHAPQAAASSLDHAYERPTDGAMSIRSFGPGGIPVTARFDVARRGDAAVRDAFAGDGRPTNDGNGWFAGARQVVRWRDARVAEVALHVADPAGEYRLRGRTDGAGRVVENASFDDDGRSNTFPEGHHRWKGTYDERGYMPEIRYFDAGGGPFLTHGKFHLWRTRFDDQGDPVEDWQFGTREEPILGRFGFHRRTQRFARVAGKPLVVEESHYGTDGLPIEGPECFARREWAYDGAGEVLTKDVYRVSADGMGVTLSQRVEVKTGEARQFPEGGQAREEHTTDANGKRLVLAFFTEDGRPTSHKGWRYHRSVAAYDDEGHEVELAFYGPDNEPVMTADYEYHRRISTYSPCYRQKMIRHFDTERRPCNALGYGHRLIQDLRPERAADCWRYYWLRPDGQVVLWRRDDKDGKTVWEDAALTR